MKIINQNGWKRFHERKGVKRTQKQQVSIPVSKKKKKSKTRGRKSGKKTNATEPYNSDWEVLSVKLAQVSFYHIIKEPKCQGGVPVCFDTQQGTNTD